VHGRFHGWDDGFMLVNACALLHCFLALSLHSISGSLALTSKNYTQTSEFAATNLAIGFKT
jgi:hypothetical protein